MSAAFHSWVVPGGFLASEGQAKRSQVWVLNVSRPENWFQEWDSHSVYTFWIQARVGGIGLAHSSLTARPHSRFAIGFSLENLNSGRCFLSSTYSFCNCYVLRRVITKQARKPRRALGEAAFFMGSCSHPLSFSTSAVLEEHLQIILDFEWVWFSPKKPTEDNLSEILFNLPVWPISFVFSTTSGDWRGAASQHRRDVLVHISLL